MFFLSQKFELKLYSKEKVCKFYLLFLYRKLIFLGYKMIVNIIKLWWLICDHWDEGNEGNGMMLLNVKRMIRVDMKNF